MSVKVECGWARVYLRETKQMCQLSREIGEGQAKYGARVLRERYKLYSQHFKEFPQLNIPDQKEFNRVIKIIDNKFGTWRSKNDKEAYINKFLPINWIKEKTITKEGKMKHTITDCKACQLIYNKYQSTFPDSKFNRVSKSTGPLKDINNIFKSKPNIKLTKRDLKEAGSQIFSEIDEKCKENYGTSITNILVMVPEAGLAKKQSPEEKRKLKRVNQRQTKENIQAKMTKNDSDAHLTLRQSFRARNEQRLSQYFETKNEAKERTDKNKKKRSHTVAMQNIEGDLDKLLEDAQTWQEGTQINWSKKAEEYGIKRSGSPDSIKNAGQTVKAFLQAHGIDTEQFKTAKSPVGSLTNKESKQT